MTLASRFHVISDESVASPDRLSVTDCGPGIPEEFRPHVFEMFSRAPDQQVSGNGIGLALAREIVQMHGGEIGFETRTRAEGDSNSGTTFWIELPRQASPGTAAPPADAASPSSSLPAPPAPRRGGTG